MAESGDPRKQDRPDGRQPPDQVTDQFPPSFSGVVTDCEAAVVSFPFHGGKAIGLRFGCGPLKLNLHFPPQAAEAVIEVIRQAKMAADTDVVPASMDTLKAMTRNGGQG